MPVCLCTDQQQWHPHRDMHGLMRDEAPEALDASGDDHHDDVVCSFSRHRNTISDCKYPTHALGEPRQGVDTKPQFPSALSQYQAQQVAVRVS